MKTKLNSNSTHSLAISASDQFTAWLTDQNLSIACTTYQTNRLFFVSGQANGRLKVQERLFDKPMGLYAEEDRLYMTTRYQLWHFDNLLGSGEKYGNCDRLYAPRTAYTTGDINGHEVVLDDAQKIIFVNTDFSCLASLSPDYSFVPLWQPPFISKLIPEDRCHLNGVAMVDGKPTYVTACSVTDTAAGWRNCRSDGGVVIQIESNEIIATGLSMPHSPRWYQGKLWLVNSGTGELGYLDNSKFVPITFCPGFVRGLAFWENFALVGLSKLRSQSFTGLALETRLEREGNTAHCGLMVIDLTNGQVVHWLHIGQTIEELFDVVVLPGVRQPEALGLQGDELQRLVRFPDSGGIITTKPTVKRPSIGEAPPVAGLPQQSPRLRENLAVKYQRVYHLNPSNALDYDDLTYPRLSQRWQQQPPRGELLGISAAVEGSMVGFVIAERINAQTAQIISLFVLPEYQRQGIGTKLLTYLEQEMGQQKCSQLIIIYEPNPAIATVLEPLLPKLGWQSPVMVGNQSKGSWKSLGTNAMASSAFMAKVKKEILTQTEFEESKRDVKQEQGNSESSVSKTPLKTALNDEVRQQFAQGKQEAQRGNLEAAVSHFQAVLSQQPDYIPALNQLGNAFQALGRFQEAIASYQKILDLNATVAPAHCNLGSIWQLQGQPEKAISAYQKAIDLEPNLGVAHGNLGKLLANQGHYQAAEQALRRALQLNPNQAELHQDLGNILRQMGRYEEAINCFRAAIKCQPDFADAYQNLGATLMFMNQFATAQSCCEKVLSLQPKSVLALDNLAHSLEAQGKYQEALTAYEQALTLEPDAPKLLYQKEHLLKTLCHWQDYDQRMAFLQEKIQGHLQNPHGAALSPLFLNCFPFPIELHTALGQHWSYSISQSMAELKTHCAFQPSLTTGGKLKIGYLSADFRRHAVGSLIEHLFEYHNRSAVEVYAYSLADTADEVTQTIQQNCDVFVNIYHFSMEAAARRIHDDGIQILIDLAGYTSLCRPQILALQPAPIQIAYLGYPDTTGADFIQYLLADRWLVPPELEQHYTEQIISLPHSFVTTPLSLTPPTTTRQALGLPEQGFVYACFNRFDKFDPHSFALWMRVLQQVPDSVLWLSGPVPETETNLRQAAQSHGITPDRLVFTPKQPWLEFVTNCQLADLFLDTFNYNAGATAICAIQAGLPVLTCPGETFASRMGASICAAAGLESLICDSAQTYEQQAVALAQEPEQLQSLRNQLQSHKEQLPLFQLQAWIAHLETVLQQLWQDYVASDDGRATSLAVVNSDDGSDRPLNPPILGDFEVRTPQTGEQGELTGNSAKPKVQYRGLQNLTVEQSLAYNELTFPKIETRWRRKQPRGQLGGIVAEVSGQPVGLVLAEVFSPQPNQPLEGEIISLLVLPNYRHQGIGTGLIQNLERGLRTLGCEQMKVIYKSSPITALALEPILNKQYWQPPQVNFFLGKTTTEKVCQAPWLRKYPLPERFSIFPWSELTHEEQQQIQTLDYPASLNPLGDTPAEPLNSLGLRYDGQLVGWMVTHRVAADAIRYSTLFVEKRFQRLGRAISLLSQSILRQAESSVPYCLFAVAEDNPKMLQFVQRHLQPYLTEVTDSRVGFKPLESSARMQN